MKKEHSDSDRVVDREDLPEEVVDIDAYREYQRAIDERDLNKWIETSDPDFELNTNLLPHVAEQQMSHLPAEEREALMELVMAQRKRLSNIGVLKKKAFGMGQGRGTAGKTTLPAILGQDKIAEVLELFGSMYTAKDVHKIICEDWGMVDVSLTQLNQWRHKNLDKIAERQEVFKREFGHLRLTHKRARLEELTYLYYHRKQLYEQTQSQNDYRLLLETIRDIKREVEGDKVVIDGKIELDIKSTINAHTQKEILGRLNLLTIVVSRIAARVNVNPIWMMTKLVNSYYAKFSGMQFAEDPMNDQILYPNNESYNFESIKAMHENMKISEAPLKKLHIDITPVQSQKAEDSKEKLRRLLKERQQQLAQSEQDVLMMKETVKAGKPGLGKNQKNLTGTTGSTVKKPVAKKPTKPKK